MRKKAQAARRQHQRTSLLRTDFTNRHRPSAARNTE